MNQPLIRVAIADDHPMIIDGVQNMLEGCAHIQLINSFKSGDLVLDGLEAKPADVLLLDIQMPNITGDELCPAILKKFPDIKVLVLTNFDSALYANNMFKRGAHGFLLKAAEREVLISAIETVYKGESFLDREMEEKVRQMSLMERNVTFSKTSLTPRELTILQLLVDGKSAPQIADEIFLSLRTVVNYRTSIMRKLDCNNIAALVKKALQSGLAK